MGAVCCCCKKQAKLKRDLDEEDQYFEQIDTEQAQKQWTHQWCTKKLSPVDLNNAPKYVDQVKDIPMIEDEQVLHLYAKLRVFDQSKFMSEDKLDSYSNLPVLGPYRYFTGDLDGCIYYGQYNRDGQMHGYGKLMQSDGSIYEGFFENNSPYKYGRNIFVGDPDDEEQDAECYEGQINEDGEAEGEGKRVFFGNFLYIGEFKNDQKEGKGIEINLTTQNRYEGQFKADEKDGKGQMNFDDGSTYNGDFKGDMIDGFGKQVWNDGRDYEGVWKQNKMNGQGKFRWLDGRTYIGIYQDDQKSGKGTLTYSDGSKHEGAWIDNHKEGNFTFIDTIGNQKQEVWVKGELQRNN